MNTASPTVFRYHERDGLVWGEYDGDTVRMGRFVGCRHGDSLQISFGHLLGWSGEVITGDATSTVRLGLDGVVELVETFGGDGSHTSVCREIAGAAT